MSKSKNKRKSDLERIKDEYEMMTSILAPYVVPPVIEEREREGSQEAGVDATANEEQVKTNLCHHEGCKRKQIQEGCISSFCFPCCFATGKDCIVHMRLRQKQEEDDR